MTDKSTEPSWSVSTWPNDVYPNDPKRARYLVRVHKDDLLRFGALARVGRELIIFGKGYQKWLQRKAVNVPGPIPFVRRQVEEQA